MRHDPSTEAIKAKLKAPRYGDVTTAHAGVASVGAAGAKPRAHDGADGNPNAAANAKFNAGTAGASETTDAGRLIGAGIIKGD